VFTEEMGDRCLAIKASSLCNETPKVKRGVLMQRNVGDMGCSRIKVSEESTSPPSALYVL